MLRHDWGAGLIVIAGLLLLSGLYLLFFKPEPHRHDGYLRADVITTIDASGDDGFLLVVHARLPDGSVHNLRTRSLALSSSVRQQVCLEQRLTESGNLKYRIAYWHQCEASGEG